MKNSLKVKISIVLSASLLVNVLLIWEIFRLREENRLLQRVNQGVMESKEDEE